MPSCRARQGAPASSYALSLCLLCAAAPSFAQGKAPKGRPAPAAAAAAAPSAAPAAPPPQAAPPSRPVPKPLSEALTGEAKADYDAGKLLFGDGDMAGALVKFTNALDKSKDARLWWNLAACEKNLRHYARTLAALERYKTEGGASITPDDVKDADALIANLRPFVAELKVVATEPGATVFIDDEPAGTTPLPRTVLVDLGERRVRVTKEGYREFSAAVAVGGSGQVTVDANLARDVHEGRLVIAAKADDVIYIDDKPVGTERWEGTLPSGAHTLRVAAVGKRPLQSDVIVMDGQSRTIQVTLEKESSSTLTWVLVGAGTAVAAAGIATSVYFASRTTTDNTARGTAGTMAPGTVQLPLLGR